jgi:serine protease AprX
MREDLGIEASDRSSALWGKGSNGGSRSSALWGKKGGRGLLVASLGVLTLCAPLGAGAHAGWGNKKRDRSNDATYVAPGVFQAAAKDPNSKLRVLIQSTGSTDDAKRAVKGLGSLRREFRRVGVVVAELPGGRIEALSKNPGLIVTLDAPVEKADYTSSQLWAYQSGAAKLWPTLLKPAPTGATIAVVDSGIDKRSPSFGDGQRIVARQVLTELQPNSGDDGRGHGTFVAGLAAGQADGYAGVSPTSNLVDLDVMNDMGMARTSDVIEACEWILDHKDSKGIRVANFSLHSSAVLSIRYHPLNRAVEKLWFAGVVVVAAAGNYGVEGGPSGVQHSPGNDPFVITVGAFDLDGSAYPWRHDIPSWSAYGYTNEGFAKPDLVAAGRYLVAPTSPNATLATEKPERVVAPGLIRLSGTSFSAPIVSGVAAQILARHPSFTPDQVKGALMATARRIPGASRLEQGRGEVNAVRAVAIGAPPNPNSGLNAFVVADASGGSVPAFDASAWYDALRSDSAWDSSAWNDSAWNDSAWNDSAWLDSAWNDSAWLDSAWLDSAWNDSAWNDATTYEDNADSEPDGASYPLDPQDLLEINSDPALATPVP